MDVGMKERGIASWYGEAFHGWLTASGEVYDMESLTAAHRTLPLGTIVRVTNMANGNQILVRINDRGPYVNGRIIDLSHAAARELEMVRDGITPVYLEVVGYEQFLAAGPGVGRRPLPTLLPYPGPWSAHGVGWPEARKPRAVHSTLDVMRARRTRRIEDILAAGQRADGLPTLALS
jgi:rare lipoprotein A (peptidoglycan hydrolase)